MKDKPSPATRKTPPAGYAKFVRSSISLLPAEQRAEALRYTSSEWVGHLRTLLRSSSEGACYFCYLEQLVAARRSKPKAGHTPNEAKAPSQFMHWTHPSLGGRPVVDRRADNETELRRREAEELLVSHIRLCDCREPLDTLVLDAALLHDGQIGRF